MEIIVTLNKSDTVAVMQIKGEINASNFTKVVDKAREIYRNPADNLILDLSEVPSISSAGQVAIHKVALIFSGSEKDVEPDQNPDFTHSSSARKHVKILSPRKDVDQSLANAGLKLFFKVYTDLETALESF